jgi:hypothetical protein
MARHTPGPWRVCTKPSTADGFSILQPDGRAVAHTRRGWEANDGATNVANACLIAASPDMYAALKALSEATTARASTAAAALVRAAIVKAEGFDAIAASLRAEAAPPLPAPAQPSPVTRHALPPAPLTEREALLIEALREAESALLRTEGLTSGAEHNRRAVLARIRAALVKAEG